MRLIRPEQRELESNNLASSYYGYLYSYVIPTLGPNAVAASNWSFAGGSGLA